MKATATRVGKIARRSVIIVAGFAVLAVGIVLVALPMIPGGLPGVLLGLTILSTELDWARRLRLRALREGADLLRRFRRGSGKDDERKPGEGGRR